MDTQADMCLSCSHMALSDDLSGVGQPLWRGHQLVHTGEILHGKPVFGILWPDKTQNSLAIVGSFEI